MPYDGPKFEKRYVDEVPVAGELCPDCNISPLKQGKFSPYCPTCKCFFLQDGGRGFQPLIEKKEHIPVIQEKQETPILEEEIKAELINIFTKFLEWLKK